MSLPQSERSVGWGTLLAASLAGGFGAAVVVAIVWVGTHLPWLRLPEQVAIPCILAAWLVSMAWFCAALPRGRAIPVGLAAGVVSGFAGLVFFGTKLSGHGASPQSVGGLVPNAWLLACGFVVLGGAMGLVGGVFGRMFAHRETPDRAAAHWLGRFAIVTCAAVVPLVFIGGLVTSTDSGMAVPDWPNTYGANMFLYPLGAHVAGTMTDASAAGKTYAQVFIEHAHRLFGAFLGVACIVLLVMTMVIEKRRWVKVLAWSGFILVCVQGVLGGLRVLGDSRLGAMAHGVLAQLTFGVIVALAVVLSGSFRDASASTIPLDPKLARRVKALTAGAMHSLVLQLLLGAAYRHFRHTHILWTHIALSVAVLLAAMLAGFTLTSEPFRRTVVGQTVRAIGIALGALVAAQFLLGWLAFAVAGRDLAAKTPTEALVRTVHQANGAILLAVAVAAFVWGRKLWRIHRPA